MNWAVRIRSLGCARFEKGENVVDIGVFVVVARSRGGGVTDDVECPGVEFFKLAELV
jgi:hypothetical protein